MPGLPKRHFFIILIAHDCKLMPENNEKPNNDIMKKWGMVNLATEFGFIIALPLVVFALVGKWADHKFGTYPWLTLAGIAIAITTTTVWMTKRLKGYIK